MSTARSPVTLIFLHDVNSNEAVSAGTDEDRSGPRPWAQPRLLARKCALEVWR